ncbi:MAG: hypothetical protein ABEL76_05140, partial [Bradymonadaceae bacterium]
VVETSGEIAVEMSRAIEAGDHQRVGRMMDLEHAMLEALGVVGGEAARAVHLARRAGAYGAKTTGAGGDGAVLALVDGQSSVAEVWGAEGWNSFDVEI